MKKNSANTFLQNSIEQMEIKRAQELILLQAEVKELRESIKPGNLIKNTIKSVTDSNDVKTGIGKTVIGIATGLLVKKVLFSKTYNPFKMAAGYLLQTGVTVLVTNNSDKINFVGKKIFKTIYTKFKRSSVAK